MRACKIVNDKVKTQLPIRKSLLKILIHELTKLYSTQPYLLLMFKALLVTMYFGLFRIGEVTSSEHVLKAKDVHIGRNKKKLQFILHTSKTHTEGEKPQTIKINSVDFDPLGIRQENSSLQNSFNDQQFCPFRILLEYLDYRKKRSHDKEQFFVFSDRSPVTATHLRQVLSKLLSRCGLDSTKYRSHSIRAGHSVDLYHLGVSLEWICKLGRWKSSAIFTYLKP